MIITVTSPMITVTVASRFAVTVTILLSIIPTAGPGGPYDYINPAGY